MPQVYNKKSKANPAPPNAVYVGRPSAWGNPATMYQESQRDEVCDAFETYARARLRREPHWLDPLIGKDLICYCAPKRCHGDTLLRLAENRAAELRAEATAKEATQ